MLIDSVTLQDLSVFPANGQPGIAGLLDHCTTAAGKEVLYRHIKNPPVTYEQLMAVQDVVRYFHTHSPAEQPIITNGTLVMLEKFFEEADNGSVPPSGIWAFMGEAFQKFFNKGSYFFTQFSLSHLSDFLKGCRQLTGLTDNNDIPRLLATCLQAMQEEMEHTLTADIISVDKDTPYKTQAKLSFYARRQLKTRVQRLVALYAQVDAWQSLAVATRLHGWCFPLLQPAPAICFEAAALRHPLLTQPRPYDITINKEHSFLLLTGANMSGKTTFMRSVGVAALLAHLGCGVPASSLRISFFKGIITNMHVEDDLLKGESYFMAEVKRMKLTAEKLQQREPHLVLMDELFKGTNVHDAYECTRAVVEGLLNRGNHLKILSTHLYEVAKHFSGRKELLFSYFVTKLSEDGSYDFEYELKDGISQDRIGYRILKNEGVLDLLSGQPG